VLISGRPGNVIFTSQEKKRGEEEKGGSFLAGLLLFCLPLFFQLYPLILILFAFAFAA